MLFHQRASLFLSVLLLGPAYSNPIDGAIGMLPQDHNRAIQKRDTFGMHNAAQISKRNHNIAHAAQQGNDHISKRNHNIAHMDEISVVANPKHTIPGHVDNGNMATVQGVSMPNPIPVANANIVKARDVEDTSNEDVDNVAKTAEMSTTDATVPAPNAPAICSSKYWSPVRCGWCHWAFNCLHSNGEWVYPCPRCDAMQYCECN